jgi:hypothetical protein
MNGDKKPLSTQVILSMIVAFFILLLTAIIAFLSTKPLPPDQPLIEHSLLMNDFPQV